MHIFLLVVIEKKQKYNFIHFVWRANVNNSVLHAVYSFCLLQWTIPLISVSKWLFFLIFLDIQVFVGSVKVLQKILMGVLEKSWIFFQ